MKFDTIEFANSAVIHQTNHGHLYNLRIVGTKWEVALYHSSHDIKGVYSFHITESENRLFERLLNTFVENATQKYFLYVDTFITFAHGTTSLYLRTLLNGEETEYFGTFSGTNYDSIARLFGIFYQLIDVILWNHILPESREKTRISNIIGLLDIRERSNYLVAKDNYRTGVFVADYDSFRPPKKLE